MKAKLPLIGAEIWPSSWWIDL